MKTYPKLKNRILLIGISLIVVLFSVWSLFHQGFPSNHDGNLYMNWLYEFDQGVREGQLLPRWSADVWAGYGAPVFNFIQPGFYYIAEGFHLTGISLINSVKVTIILAVVLGYLFMFLWSREVWKNEWVALLSAAIYVWSPYHLGNIYLRGSFAELLALAWWPLILFCLVSFIKSEKFKYVIFLILGIAALFLSHNALTVIFIPVALIYLLILSWKKWRLGLISLGAVILGAGLSAFFWLPAFIEKKYLNLELLFLGNRNYTENFINFRQLFYNEWKEYLFLVGLTGLIVFIITIYALVEKNSIRNILGKRIYLWLGVIAVSVFMTGSSSRFIWDNISWLKFFQFPWRLLSLVSLSLAALSGIIIYIYDEKNKWSKPIITSLILIALTVFVNSSYISPLGYLKPLENESYKPLANREEKIDAAVESGEEVIKVFYFSDMPEFFTTRTTLDSLRDMLREMVDQYINNDGQDGKDRILIPEKLEVISGSIEVKSQDIKTTQYVYYVEAHEDSEVQINTLWFPGWKIFIDGGETQPIITEGLGVLSVKIPKGDHSLKITFQNTPIRSVGVYISIFSLLLVIILLIFSKSAQLKIRA